MISKKLFLLLFLFLRFLYFSNGQSVLLYSAEHQPIEGAVIVLSSIDGSQSEVKFSDYKGETVCSGVKYPLVRRITMMGFKEQIDTLKNPNPIPEKIHLVKANKNLGEVTVTGNMMPGYQANSVYKVDVIGRNEIDCKAANTVKDLLSQELNMKVSNDPILGSSLNLQGTGGEHIKFLIDGVPVIGRMNGNINLGQLNLSNVERVEIVKGPMSVLYGTDALGGVVNLITKINTKQKLSAGITTYYENTGIYNADGYLGWGFKNSSLNISGGRNFFDGWNNPDTTRWQSWKPSEQYFGNVKLSHQVKGWRLSLQSDYFQEEVINKTNTTITPYYAYALDQYYYTRRFNNQVSVNKQFNTHSAVQFTAAHSYYRYIKNTKSKNMVELTEVLTPDPSDDDTTKFKSVFSRANYVWSNLSGNLSTLSGVDYNYESAIGKRIDNAEHKMSDYAAFTSIEYKPFSQLTIRPSVRAIYNSLYNAPIIPAINFLYKPAPLWSVRASWSKGFRAPSLKEQYLIFFDNGNHNVHGNPDLLAEHSSHVMGSVEMRKAFSKVVFFVEPSFFFNDIKNRISLVEKDASTKLYTYINLDDFTSRGAELKGKISGNQFHFEAGYAYTGTRESFSGQSEQPAIAWYNEFNTSADYTVKKFKTTISVFWKYLGNKSVYRLNADGSLSRFVNDPYQLMDASIRQPLSKDRIAITVGVKNLLNVTEVKAYSSSSIHSGNSNNETPVGMGTAYFAKISIVL